MGNRTGHKRLWLRPWQSDRLLLGNAIFAAANFSGLIGCILSRAGQSWTLKYTTECCVLVMLAVCVKWKYIELTCSASVMSAQPQLYRKCFCPICWRTYNITVHSKAFVSSLCTSLKSRLYKPFEFRLTLEKERKTFFHCLYIELAGRASC